MVAVAAPEVVLAAVDTVFLSTREYEFAVLVESFAWRNGLEAVAGAGLEVKKGEGGLFVASGAYSVVRAAVLAVWVDAVLCEVRERLQVWAESVRHVVLRVAYS